MLSNASAIETSIRVEITPPWTAPIALRCHSSACRLTTARPSSALDSSMPVASGKLACSLMRAYLTPTQRLLTSDRYKTPLLEFANELRQSELVALSGLLGSLLSCDPVCAILVLGGAIFGLGRATKDRGKWFSGKEQNDRIGQATQGQELQPDN